MTLENLLIGLFAIILTLALVPVVIFIFWLSNAQLDGNQLVRDLRKLMMYVLLSNAGVIGYLDFLTIQGFFDVNLLGQATAALFLPFAAGVLWANWYALVEFRRIRKVLDEVDKHEQKK